jgi:hypothetical protein
VSKISELNIGDEYKREDLDYYFDTGERIAPPSLEGWFYIASPVECTVLLTGLEKDKKIESHNYNNYFEGDFFHQDSQNNMTINTERLKKVINKECPVYLFCRTRRLIKNVTQPYIYCGQVEYFDHDKNTEKPVHLVYQCLEYQDETDNLSLLKLYNWKPEKIGGKTSNNINFSKTISERRKQKYSKHTKPTITSKLGFVNQRLGQPWFRAQILDKWDYKCAVTGYDNFAVCIASHIVPWKDSEEDRLEIDNGILLSPDLDALFDKKLISFQDNGQIIISKKIEKKVNVLGINEHMSLSKVNEGMKKYLSWHREEFFKQEEKDS